MLAPHGMPTKLVQGLEKQDMMIRTGQVQPLPLSVSQETMVLGEDVMVSSTLDVDRSTTVHHTASLHSTACRLAGSVHKLSNVKQDTRWSSLESVQLSKDLTQHSSNAARSSESASLDVVPTGATPPLGTPISYLGATSSERVKKIRHRSISRAYMV